LENWKACSPWHRCRRNISCLGSKYSTRSIWVPSSEDCSGKASLARTPSGFPNTPQTTSIPSLSCFRWLLGCRGRRKHHKTTSFSCPSSPCYQIPSVDGSPSTPRNLTPQSLLPPSLYISLPLSLPSISYPSPSPSLPPLSRTASTP
jgi:hypothetical protein